MVKTIQLEMTMNSCLAFTKTLVAANGKLHRQLRAVASELQRSKESEVRLLEDVDRLDRRLRAEATNRKHLQATFAEWQVIVDERMKELEAQDAQSKRKLKEVRNELIATKLRLSDAEEMTASAHAKVEDRMSSIKSLEEEIGELKRDLIEALKNEEQTHSEHLEMTKDFERKTTKLQAVIRELRSEMTKNGGRNELPTDSKLNKILSSLYREVSEKDNSLRSLQNRQQAMWDQISRRKHLAQDKLSSFLINEEYARLQREFPELGVLVVRQDEYVREVRTQMKGFHSRENDPKPSVENKT